MHVCMSVCQVGIELLGFSVSDKRDLSMATSHGLYNGDPTGDHYILKNLCSASPCMTIVRACACMCTRQHQRNCCGCQTLLLFSRTVLYGHSHAHTRRSVICRKGKRNANALCSSPMHTCPCDAVGPSSQWCRAKLQPPALPLSGLSLHVLLCSSIDL